MLSALAGSIALHLGLAVAMAPGMLAHRSAAVDARIHVRLVPAGAIEPEPLETETVAESVGSPDVLPAPAVRAHPRPVQTQTQTPAPSTPAQAEPRYYASHELDVFPRLVRPLGRAPQAALDYSGAGRLLLELSIDADGLVRRISVLDSGPPDAAAARKLWMDARFDPARKSGRAVASRIEIELDYGPLGAAR